MVRDYDSDKYIQDDPFTSGLSSMTFALNIAAQSLVRQGNTHLEDVTSGLRELHWKVGVDIAKIAGKFDRYETLVLQVHGALDRALNFKKFPDKTLRLSRDLANIKHELRTLRSYKERITIGHVELQAHFNQFVYTMFPGDDRPQSYVGELFQLRNDYFDTAELETLKQYFSKASTFVDYWLELQGRDRSEHTALATQLETLSELETRLEVFIMLEDNESSN
jgi:hypothetical protein